jgi:hypothetical protein
MTDLQRAKNRLLQGGYTCVLCKENDEVTSTSRGVKPLVAWLEQGKRFDGYSAADKVVGKATAFLYILLGVKAVYANVISQPAKAVLSSHAIAVEYATLTETIINRAGNGPCPFEQCVLEAEEPFLAYERILSQMKSMGITLA